MYKSFSEIKVLIAEDLESSRKVALYHLKKLGCIARVAENGIEALNLCRREQFDLVFMDLEMPMMSGTDALHQIRTESNPNIETPVVALTANDDEDSTEKSLEKGFCQIINKPFRKQDLMDALNKWVG